MAKDPAFLFYPGDWLGGTMLLTRHQKGCYIDLLMAQFNAGPLSLDQIKTVLGQDQAHWTVLQAKFKQDATGKYFNEKLATEIEKRKGYVASRSNNKSGRKKSNGKSYDKSNDFFMKGHMENENENVNTDVLEKGAGENLLPLGYRMQQHFLQINPTYPPRPSQDFPAITTIAEFIYLQQYGKEQQIAFMDPDEKEYVLMQWMDWCIWYHDNGKNKSLETLVKFKLQEIYSELKNGKKNERITANQPDRKISGKLEATGHGGY